MNMLKRMASIAVVAIMVLQIAVFAAPVPEDVIGTEYEASASLLCALDIMVGDGENFNPDANVTRAEFAQIMTNALKLAEAAESYSPVGLFTDVATNAWYAAPIEIGAGLGAIKGYGDGTFGPEDNVLGHEAVKMMIYACGYEVTAEANGGYPAGYMMTAQEIGLLKGIMGIDFAIPMTRGQAAVLCANTVKVDMRKKVTTGDKITYKETKDVNILSEKHKVYKIEGVISANDVTGMWESSTLREGYVMIESGANSGIYNAGATKIADAIGQYVRAYYKYDNDLDENTIVSYEVLGNRTEITKVDLEDFNYKKITNTKVEYWKDKDNDTRATEIKISSTPAIIFNGATRQKNLSVKETFQQIEDEDRIGEVTMIDNDGDGVVDVLSFMAYETVVVASADQSRYNIKKEDDTYKGSTSTIKIDIDSSTVTVDIVDTDGDEAEFSDISAGSILSVAKSDEGSGREYVYVIISDESIDGEISEIGVDDGEYIFTIDGEKYKAADTYMNYITKSSGSLKIKVGSTGEFFLDAFGRIAYGKASNVSEDAYFGLLRNFAPGRGADDTLQFRLYVDGEYVDYTAAAKVEVDGVRYDTLASLQAAVEASVAKVVEKGALYEDADKLIPVLFELNDDEKIKKIDTPYVNTTEGESEYSLQPVSGKALEFSSDIKYMKGTSTLEGTKYKLSGSSTIISLPAKYSDIDNLRRISNITSSSLPTDKSIKKVMMLTTEPDSYDVQYAIVKINEDTSGGSGGGRQYSDLTSTEAHDAQIMVVSSVVEALTGDDNDEPTIKLVGMQAGSSVEYELDPEYYSSGDFYNAVWTGGMTGYADESILALKDPRRGDATNIKDGAVPGDVLRVWVDSQGRIDLVKPVFLMDTKVFRSDDQGGTDNPNRYRGFDIAVAYEIKGSDAQFKYLLNKKTVNKAENNAGVTRVLVDKNGFVTGAQASTTNYDPDKNLELYDSAEQKYLINKETGKLNGMDYDEAYALSSFEKGLMVFDVNTGKVTRGDDSDLVDISSPNPADKAPASLVIMQFRGTTGGPTRPQGMIIYKF